VTVAESTQSQLEAMIDTLLWEGYALYPYTPGATKNATPTPFGIVYPPVYAAGLQTTYDHLELRCELEAPADAVLEAELRFLASGATRHMAGARTLTLPGAMVGALAVQAAEKEASVEPEQGPPLVIGLTLGAAQLGPGRYEVWLRVENRTVVSSGLDRAGALARSLLSTHPVLRVTGGRFISPLEREYASVNTFPVLATPADDAVIGAAIVLPDHPQIAPESRGSMFDGTEIEEALLLHVQVLSDEERAEIERQDPTVREMINRAAAATPEDIVALHGRTELRDPQTDEPPPEPAWLPDPRAGEETVDVGGKTFRRGGKVVIRPPADADIQARMLEGRTATIEKIFTDYDGKTHLGVTIDDDPGQELMRETGRYLYFFGPEVEVLQ
jgi:hypothetical protein